MKKLYVSVDQQTCQGHALCHLAMPEIYLSDDETGHSYTADSPVPAELAERALAVASNCPERAITSEYREDSKAGAQVD